MQCINDMSALGKKMLGGKGTELIDIVYCYATAITYSLTAQGTKYKNKQKYAQLAPTAS